MFFANPVMRVVFCVAAVSASAAAPARSGPNPLSYGYLSNPYIPVPVSVVVGDTLTRSDGSPLNGSTPRVLAGPTQLRPATASWPLQPLSVSADITGALSWPASEASYGYAPGYAGIAVFDVGHDGGLDVLASAHGNYGGYWYVASWTPQGLKKTFVSRSYEVGIVDFGVATLNGIAYVSVATPTSLYVYRLDDLALVSSMPLPAGPRRARLADLDQDGNFEVVVLTGGDYYYYPSSPQSISVYDLATQALSWDVPLSSWAYELAIGDFRDEPGLEIVVAGEASQVVSGSSGATLWSPPGNLRDIVSGNFDSDPQLEFAGIESWDILRVYDARQSAQLWSLGNLGDLEHVGANDFDRDGQHELLVGSGQWGDVCVYSSITHLRIHCIDNREHGVGRMAAGDVDGTGPDEIIWGAGVSSTGEDQLAVGNFTSLQELWWGSDESPAHPDSLVADVDLDGAPDYVYATYASRSGYDSGRIHVADPTTMRDKWVSATFAGGLDWLGTGGLDIGQLDGDAASEIVVATAQIRTPVLEIYDGATHAREQTVVLPDDGPYGTPARLPRVIDAANVLVAYNGTLRKIRLSDGVATWTSQPLIGGLINTLGVAQLDDDPSLEAVAATDGAVTVVDLDTGVTEWSLLVGGAATLDRSTKQLVLGAGVQARVYDIPSRTLIRSYPLVSFSTAAWVANVAGQRIVFVSLDNGGLQGFLADSGELVLSQQTDRPGFAWHASHVPTFVQGNTVSFWSPSNYAVHRAEATFVTTLFSDSFE